MRLPGKSPLYSADSSALIDLKEWYPKAIFARMWDLLSNLLADQRLLICEEVYEECTPHASESDELAQFLRMHESNVVSGEETEPHLSALVKKAYEQQIQVVNPNSTKNRADPHVVALALWAERRNLRDLSCDNPQDTTCIVVTHEKLGKRPPQPNQQASIPYVCQRFNLAWCNWLEFLQAEKYQD